MLLTRRIVQLLWIPLRERPGLGTLAFALLIGPMVNRTLPLLRVPEKPRDASGSAG